MAKYLGAALGFFWAGFPGALVGFFVGNFISGWSSKKGTREITQSNFFRATFMVMGHVAKVDGEVTREEIAFAQLTMNTLGLTGEEEKNARELFYQGKSTNIGLDGLLQQLSANPASLQAAKILFHKSLESLSQAELSIRLRELRDNRSWGRMLCLFFVELQIGMALADGKISPKERKLLFRIAREMGISAAHFERLEASIKARFNWNSQTNGNWRGGSDRQSYTPADMDRRIEDAYRILELNPGTDFVKVKKAYRRMISKNHPDKLVSQGLPEEMVAVANRKTQAIVGAYELLEKQHRARN